MSRHVRPARAFRWIGQNSFQPELITNLTEQDRTALSSVLQCIISDFGLVDPPAAGCAVRTRDMGQDKIAQVVQEVMAVLDQRGII